MRCNTSFGPYCIIVAVVAAVVALKLLVPITPTAFFALTTLSPRIAMPERPIAKEIRDAIKWDFEQGRSNEWIAAKRVVHPRTVARYRHCWESFGDPYVPSFCTGRPRLLPDEAIETIREYLIWNPDAYLNEISWMIWDDFGIQASNQTIGRAILHDLNITRKKYYRIAAQRDPRLRARFYTRMAQYEPEELVFLDESASCERTADRRYGWSLKGTPYEKTQSLKKSKRWSILPAFTTEGYIACHIHQGSFTQELYTRFVVDEVLPLCSGVPGGKWSVLVMDNASCHRDPELLSACAEAGVKVEFLPPYSPDMNPIETSFSCLKDWIRHYSSMAMAYEEDPELGGFGVFLEQAIRGIHPDNSGPDPVALFRHSGYVSSAEWEHRVSQY